MGWEEREAEIPDPMLEAFAPGCPSHVRVLLEEGARSLHPTRDVSRSCRSASSFPGEQRAGGMGRRAVLECINRSLERGKLGHGDAMVKGRNPPCHDLSGPGTAASRGGCQLFPRRNNYIKIWQGNQARGRKNQ